MLALKHGLVAKYTAPAAGGWTISHDQLAERQETHTGIAFRLMVSSPQNKAQDTAVRRPTVAPASVS